jgi:DNA mismatch repair ATPase MutS
LLPNLENETIVDAKTWDDLNFDSIFAKMDRNISGVGQQYLYHLLHKYEFDEKLLKQRFDLISYLKEFPKIREKIQLALSGLNNTSSYFISFLVLSKSLPKTKLYPLFYLSSLLCVISLILIPYKGIFLFIALAILLNNIILNKLLSGKIYQYFTGFSGLNALLISGYSISKINHESPVREIELLRNKRDLLKSLKKKLGYLVIDKEKLNELAIVAIEYLNMFLLFDIIAYYRSVNTLLKHQEEIHEIFKAVAILDASISIASYLEEIKKYSNPVFKDTGSIDFKSLYHPLIVSAVPNSVDSINKSVLITGSNMSGKTTFIKTIGINYILSQTLYFAHSDMFTAPRRIIKTSIKRNEEMEKGKSYFFVEIEELKSFIDLSIEKSKYLFLIDEIFRGTNTIERLAASTSVLKHLSLNNMVFVTTHDIELQELLENSFVMFHFSEQVEDGKYFFNYKINEGPCSSGNAIRLLEIMGYPNSLTEEAHSIAKELLSNNYGSVKPM